MTRRTAQMVRSPVARRAPTARSWALTPRCGRRTVERRRPGWLRSQVADPRGSVSANDGSYVTIDRGQRPPGSASRFGQSRDAETGETPRANRQLLRAQVHRVCCGARTDSNMILFVARLIVVGPELPGVGVGGPGARRPEGGWE